MARLKVSWPVVLKWAVALIAIGSLLLVAGQSLAPSMSPFLWLLRCVAVLMIFAAVATCLVLISLTIRQFILRKGGTDTQWFWFRSGPPGLEAQRQSDKANPREQD